MIYARSCSYSNGKGVPGRVLVGVDEGLRGIALGCDDWEDLGGWKAVSQNTDYIGDGESGAAPPRDESRFGQEVETLPQDRRLRARLGQKRQETIETEFSCDGPPTENCLRHTGTYAAPDRTNALVIPTQHMQVPREMTASGSIHFTYGGKNANLH